MTTKYVSSPFNNTSQGPLLACHMFLYFSFVIVVHIFCILLVKTIKHIIISYYHRIAVIFVCIFFFFFFIIIFLYYIIEQKVIPLFMMSSIRMEASKGVTELIDESTKASSVGPTFIIRRRSYSSRYLP